MVHTAIGWDFKSRASASFATRAVEHKLLRIRCLYRHAVFQSSIENTFGASCGVSSMFGDFAAPFNPRGSVFNIAQAGDVITQNASGFVSRQAHGDRF